MAYDDGVPEEWVSRNEKLLGLKDGLKEGHLAWVDGPKGRRLVVTEKGRMEMDRQEVEEAVGRRPAHWR